MSESPTSRSVLTKQERAGPAGFFNAHKREGGICTGIPAMTLSPDNKTVAFACFLHDDFRRDGRRNPDCEVLLADIAAARKGVIGDDAK